MITVLACEILVVALLTAVTCSLVGIFLVLRGASLMSDALSHSMLPGIVLLFFITRSLHSPLLLAGGCMAGLCMVFLIETVVHTKRIQKDAAIGISFPLFFSLGVILITLYARNIHLDTDMVLLGELAFAPFNRLSILGIDCGPKAMLLMLFALGVNSLFIRAVYKELVVSTFDPEYAEIAGLKPQRLYYIFMMFVSLTIVIAFDVVGAIVVVSLMTVPTATALLLTKHLPSVFFITLILALSGTLYGYAAAHYYDVSVAGCLAVAQGVLFGATVCYQQIKRVIKKV